MEQRVVAFAEQRGRIVGTVQAKAKGGMDRDALNAQIASVRDGAADLLEQLSAGVTKARSTAKKVTKKARSAPAKPRGSVKARGAGGKGRSGGMVDAPGKRHRKAPPSDPDATVADSQAAKMRTAMTMVKTNRRRGRG
jgi:hypothetical protein